LFSHANFPLILGASQPSKFSIEHRTQTQRQLHFEGKKSCEDMTCPEAGRGMGTGIERAWE